MAIVSNHALINGYTFTSIPQFSLTPHDFIQYVTYFEQNVVASLSSLLPFRVVGKMKEASEEDEVRFCHYILDVWNRVTIWCAAVHVFDASVVFTTSNCSSKNADSNPCMM